MKKEFLCGMVGFALFSACATKNEPKPVQQQNEVVQKVKDSKKAIAAAVKSIFKMTVDIFLLKE